MYTEDDLLPISALQHLVFCERQWGLIHLEAAWAENRLTAEGRVLHDKAHEPETEARKDLRIARGLRLRSFRLGLTGMADVVEFHRQPEGGTGTTLPGVSGLWMPFIVEYKRGSPKMGHEDEVQLCAQAFCLEEMLGVTITFAAFFYGEPRRRTDVILDKTIRQETEIMALRLHEFTEAGITPPAKYDARCKSCSLVNLCLPSISSRKSALTYLNKAVSVPWEIGP